MNDVKINSNSIEEMYTKYYTSLKRHCIKLASYNPQFVSIAEDCVQEAFYRAVCHAEDFASSPNQYGWLATCCSHYMLSHIRQAKKREKIIGKSMISLAKRSSIVFSLRAREYVMSQRSPSV